MAQENPHTPDTTEEVQANAEEAGTPETAAPALNRAQRRAQSRGKTGACGPNTPAAHQGGSHPGGRSGGHAGPVRFPRTGHK